MELSSLELQLFDRICRSVLQNLREEAATRRAGNNVDINEQVVNLLSEVVELIDNCLIPLCPIEDCVLYNLMKGDLLVFLAEMYDSGQHCSAATVAYEEAFEAAAKTCGALHPSRIRAAVSLATFLDKSGSCLKGYTIVSKAVRDIENALKSAKKCNCSPELKSSLLLLNKLKEELQVKLSGRKGLLPYAEMLSMKALEEEDPEVYRLGSINNKEDDQPNRRYRSMKQKYRQ